MLYLIMIVALALLAVSFINAKKAEPALAITPTLHYEGVAPTVNPEPLTIDFEEQWESAQPELLMDQETLQLLEAEKLLSEVDTIIASHQDVYPKLKAALSRSAVLFDPEFRDAIQKYIRLTAYEDCQLELSNEELTVLWV
ncbi:MAG TPA: hypothetical protein VF408_03285 [Sediminibacterium sp.]